MTDAHLLKEQQKVQIIQRLADFSNNTDLGEFKNIIFNAVMNSGQEVTCLEFVNNYLKSQSIDVLPNGIYKNGDLIRNHKAFFHRLHQSFKEYKRTFGLKNNFSREELALEVEAILEESWDTKRTELRASLLPEDNPVEYDKLLTSLTICLCGQMVTDYDQVEFRLSKAFLAHFFWQISMRLHKGSRAILKGGNQAVLMLVSPKQKTGKSTAVRYMVDCLDTYGFVWRATLDRLADQFSYGNLAYNYVALFDDMHRSSNLNMGSFKQIVTQDEVHFRSMHTQTEMKLPQMATLIGTSNKSPRELMNDTTGLRRFHQILVNNGDIFSGKGIDLDTLTQIDFARIIKLTPLEDTSPMFTYITDVELAKYEESIRPLHVVEHWLNDSGYTPGEAETGDLLPLKDLFEQLRMWAGEHGYGTKYIPTAISLASKMHELGYQKGRNSQFRGYYITKETP